MESNWPFLPKADFDDLNLGFDDLLEFQYARSRSFTALIVGAYDGMENDPSGRFIHARPCRAILVEPQPGPYRRLCQKFGDCAGVTLVNAAIDEHSGSRDLYCIQQGVEGLPEWVEQIASFDKAHLLKHEKQAPGLSGYIQSLKVRTTTFDSLLTDHDIERLDLLQIDAEDLDAKMLSWFPFDRVKPALLHFEVAHMSNIERCAANRQLREAGYLVYPGDSPTDDMAVLL